MAVCTYDNPNTFARECWQDGVLIAKYSANILPPFSRMPIPQEHFFFGANIGEWKTGQLFVDAAAMTNDV